MLSILLIKGMIQFIRLELERKKYSKMAKAFLHIKYTKRKELIELLTNNRDIIISDITKVLQVDICSFESRYKKLLYQELVKIKEQHELNPRNWRLFLKLLDHNSAEE